MEITAIRVHLMDEGKLKAFACVTFDNCFVVRNMKVVEGSRGLFLCMPSRKLADGTHKDMAHPITQEFRKQLEDRIFAAYKEALSNPDKYNSPIDNATSSMHDGEADK
ncbi:MAG: septation protein SpoVG [Elusimicrobia bacterium]|nr:septation protein SpoVG [Elusimicrobiota bacterium]